MNQPGFRAQNQETVVTCKAADESRIVLPVFFVCFFFACLFRRGRGGGGSGGREVGGLHKCCKFLHADISSLAKNA